MSAYDPNARWEAVGHLVRTKDEGGWLIAEVHQHLPNAKEIAEAIAAIPDRADWAAHLEAFIGPSAMDGLRASFAAGMSPGGAAP